MLAPIICIVPLWWFINHMGWQAWSRARYAIFISSSRPYSDWLEQRHQLLSAIQTERNQLKNKTKKKKTQNVLVYQLRGLRRFCRSRPIDGFGRSSKSAIRIMRIWIIELVTYQLANALQSNAQIEVCLQFAFCCLLFRNAQHSTSWMAQCTRKLMWLAVLCLRKSATDRRQPVR